MGVFGGDFLGFSYGSIHSEELGLLRTIDNRYNYQLTPPIRDTITEVPNYTGVYFWGSDYDRRNITIPFAFYDVGENQLSKIKKIFNSKKVQELIFDEDPNIIYPAMVANTSTLSYVCFDIEGERVYKGEGSLNFICHTPYKHSKHNYTEEVNGMRQAGKIATIGLEEPNDQPFAKLVPTQKEPYSASIITESKFELSNLPSDRQYGHFVGDHYILLNNGNCDTPFQIYFKLENDMDIYISRLNSSPAKELFLKIPGPRIMNYLSATTKPDVFVKIDTSNYTVIGCDSNYNPTGTLYNDCIIKGNFFTLPKGRNDLRVLVKRPWKGDAANIDLKEVNNITNHPAGECASRLDLKYKYI